MSGVVNGPLLAVQHVYSPRMGARRRKWVVARGTAPGVRPWAVMIPAVGAAPLWYGATVAVSPWLGGLIAGGCLILSTRFALPWWSHEYIAVDSLTRQGRRTIEEAIEEASTTLVACDSTGGAIQRADVLVALERELWRIAVSLKRLEGVAVTVDETALLNVRVETYVRRIRDMRRAMQRLAYAAREQGLLATCQLDAEPSTLESLSAHVEHLADGMEMLGHPVDQISPSSVVER